MGLNSEEIQSLYDENGELKADSLQILLDKDKEIKSKLKPEFDEKTIRDEGYKRGVKESLSKLEKDLKTKYALVSEKTGIELIEEIVSTKSTNTQITDDVVTSHPAFHKAVEAKTAEFQQLIEAKENEIKTIHSTIEAENTFKVVSREALKLFAELNPIVSQNETVKQNQINTLLLNPLNGYKYKIEEGEIYVLDNEGKVKTNAHGARIKFKDVVKEITSNNFELAVAKSRESGDAGTSGTGGKKPITAKTEAEFVLLINSAKSKAELDEYQAAYVEFADSQKN